MYFCINYKNKILIYYYLPIHFKHHNGTFGDFNKKDEENFLLTDMTSNVRSGISL